MYITLSAYLIDRGEHNGDQRYRLDIRYDDNVTRAAGADFYVDPNGYPTAGMAEHDLRRWCASLGIEPRERTAAVH